ncbi:spermine oxidase-like [Euwallacea fornicatus]|uniref:spermine oxidase-like n=1 Tax=Euwallacea fornicatus TaxID=995702 RepID=UPI0033902CF6
MWIFTQIVIFSLLRGLLGVPAPSEVSIIVIGSGPSGIAASTKLLKNNFTNITILEAEHRIGGRINSVRFGNAYVDLGAEFCHGQEGNIVYSMEQSYNILQHSTEDFQILRSNGEKVDKKTRKKLIDFAESLAASNETTEGCEYVKSVGECLRIKAKEIPQTSQDPKEVEILTEAIEFVDAYLCSYDSSFDLNDLKSTTEYKLCGGDIYMNWNGHGYKTILEIMMEKYPNNKGLPIDDKIFMGKEVDNITNWDEDKITVTTTDGNKYLADHVIFTPSLGVLKADHERLFSPALSEDKVEAIKQRGFGAILKVILHFPDKWWDSHFYMFLFTKEDKDVLKKKNMEWLLNINGFSQAESNPNVLIAWFAGKYVPRIENLTDEEVLTAHKFVIHKFLSPYYNVTMPDKLLKSEWYSNPHFRGTYSYESAKSTAKNLQAKLAAPLNSKTGKPNVMFAGEATHPHYFSTVHGAIESGYREAERLIQLYK